MSNARERKLRRKNRAALRALERELEIARAAVSEVAELRAIALVAERYVDEIYAPDLKEPFSIFNRRQDLVEIIRARQAQRRAPLLRKAA